ncbi:maleylpyruvate isomerase family mycothiol-dependent enzyme [Streptomyces drozdowiczii]|uniref:Maleylpyruvate isomerase family mycothiol-dependent enzyme n=1 Tax=Streptomyces drozdowiczii TaxID=202862 RepID=A0ABY6PZA2_9ACTN|nr:maleylpyruvate isomerase family mycothiol-dependent enzyme [Streptomyces drozdowiczii]MCX0242427.1 maleylpyruvate isomerase family mycothiol-dependent enzyme [Streptomyces drozdowiczii]UZK57513.1 maleylpyruvate isomerase family mycothiol-dependent enzyme [Streptomyces drozdowiczii]
MKITEHIAALAAEGRLLADAADEAGTGAPVPTCPDWRVRDLLRHTTMVHAWAAAFVREGHTSYVPDGGEPELDGPELVAHFRAGHRLLVEALENAPQDVQCWSFLPASSPLAFWARRQAHETTIHRVDAESARGGDLSPVGADHALDGIDELLRGMHARPKSRVRTETPRTLRVRATDTDTVWTVRLSAEPPVAVREEAPAGTPPVDCELSAPAQTLYLALWNRLPLTALTVTGDEDLARLWRDNSSITWS